MLCSGKLVRQVPCEHTVLSPLWSACGAGKYKLVTFAHRELNLHKVFWEVQARGGYQAVCATKQWKARPCPCHIWQHCGPIIILGD